jgi:hypothetical protein
MSRRRIFSEESKKFWNLVDKIAKSNKNNRSHFGNYNCSNERKELSASLLKYIGNVK